MADIGKLRLTISWLKQLAVWLSRARMLGLAIIPIVISGAYLWCEHLTEPHVRWTGLALQLTGVLSVAFGVASTRRMFGQPSLFARVRAYISDVPRFPRPATNVAIAVSGLNAMTSAGNVTIGVAPEQTIEARLLELEHRVSEIATKAAKDTAEIRGDLRKQNALLVAESANRSDGDILLHRQVEMTATGGLDLSLCGLLWLLVGSVFGTIPLELSHLF